MMRRFLAAAAAALLALCPIAAEAQAPAQAAAVRSGLGGFTPPSVRPQTSAYFGQENGFLNNTAGANIYWAGLKLPTGAMYPPTSSVLKSWVIAFDLTIAPELQNYYSGGTYLQTLLGFCGSPACSSGGDRYLQVTSPYTNGSDNTRNLELVWAANRTGSTTNVWKPPTLSEGAVSTGCSGSQNCRTGIHLQLGRSYKVFLIQYGSDSATPGIVAIAVLDTTGAHVSGSPVLSTTTNQDSTVVGYYYSAASTLAAQSTMDMFRVVGATSLPASFTAKIDNGSGASGNILTVSSVSGNPTTLDVGMKLTGAGIAPGTVITAKSPTVACGGAACTGAGNTGTYAVSNPANTGSITVEGLPSFSRGSPGPIANLATLWGVMPNSAGVPDLATLKTLAGGNSDFKAAALAAGFTVHFFAKLNDPGTWAAELDGVATNLAQPNNANTLVAGPPPLPPSCVKLTEYGDGDVYAADPGQTGSSATGHVYFDGTIDKSLCKGPVEAQVYKLADGSAVTPWRTLPMRGSSAFRGSVAGVPVSPQGWIYGRRVRPKRAPSYVYTSPYSFGVGLVIGATGQSDSVCQMQNPVGTQPAGGKLIPDLARAPYGEHFSVLSQPLVDYSSSSLNASNSPNGKASIRKLTPYNTLGLLANNFGASDGNAPVGDGVIYAMKALHGDSRFSGWPIKYVVICKNGTPADAWVYDYTPGSVNMVLSSGFTYTATLGNPTQFISGAVFQDTGAARVTTKRGTVKVFVSGVQVGADDGNKNITGATIQSGSVNYYTGAVSITFTGAPGATPVITWTSVQDTIGSTYTKNAALVSDAALALNYGTFGDGSDPTSGYFTSVASMMSGPPSMWTFTQCSSDSGEVQSQNAAVDPTGFQNKWRYIFDTKMKSFWWWDGSRPVLVFGYSPRGGNQAISAGCRRALLGIAGNGAGATTNGISYAYGSEYWDYWDWASVQNSPTGHPFTDAATTTSFTANSVPYNCAQCMNSHYGSERVARRWAAAIGALQAQTPSAIRGPVLSGQAFSADKTVAHLYFTLFNGTSLATCGPSQSSLGCNPTTTAGAVVKGITFGDGTVSYNEAGWNEQAHSVDPTKTFSCVLAGTSGAITQVDCTKTGSVTTFTASSQTYVGIFTADFWRGGTLADPVVTSPGAGYTPANSTTQISVTVTGSCTISPKITYQMDGLGHITNAWASDTGQGCSDATTFTAVLPSNGSGGAVTAPTYTQNMEKDDYGYGLYDNSGGFGSYEPGLPVQVSPQPVLVS